MDTKDEFVYLLQEREFIKTGENIFKIGMTTQSGLARFKQYPKGSKLLLHVLCHGSRLVESVAIIKFKQMFKQRRDIGTEYFEGDPYQMMTELFNLARCSLINDAEPEPKLNIKHIPTPILMPYTPRRQHDHKSIVKNLLLSSIDKFWHKDKLFGGSISLSQTIDGKTISINPDVYDVDVDFDEYEFLVIDGCIWVNEILPSNSTEIRRSFRCSDIFLIS